MENKEVDGYENHWWNGITCKEYARLLEYMIDHKFYWKGVRHLVPPYQTNKYDLCCLVRDVFQLDIPLVKRVKTDIPMNRVLGSVQPSFPIPIKGIKDQLRDLFVSYDVQRVDGPPLRVKFIVINLPASERSI